MPFLLIGQDREGLRVFAPLRLADVVGPPEDSSSGSSHVQT
jgi:hypothetical protein